MRSKNEIGNKLKRRQVFAKQKEERKKAKIEARRLKKEKIAERIAAGATLADIEKEKEVPRTLDSMREKDDTMLQANSVDTGDEVRGDVADDEFAKFEDPHNVPAKIMITTRPRPSKHLFGFISEIVSMLPNTYFYPRRSFTLKDICKFAANKKFTHLIVLHERLKKCNTMIVSGLPHGPTACFKVSSVVSGEEISGHGRKTDHIPEVVLNNFKTRLGLRIGRMLGSMFPQDPEFEGRRVVTFHNQRDYIFVRHHRYIFESGKRARLQELGPRFTLKLRWLQESTFSTKEGEYEFFFKRREVESSRRRFFL